MFAPVGGTLKKISQRRGCTSVRVSTFSLGLVNDDKYFRHKWREKEAL